ncbi:FUN14 family-domain-containing protein [Gaertneriomyces semiglobifer]|nr:FUN14 family-domain-containing protein [Gaertneriomyces semiglobifer]
MAGKGEADVLEPVRATTETDPKILSNDAATLSEVSMASLLGACSGYAAKKLAKTTGLIVGVSFIGVQVLVKADILKVNWPRVETLLIGQVDQDGDGKLTHQDLKLATGRMLHNLTTDMPSSAGFAAAFALGFRYG